MTNLDDLANAVFEEVDEMIRYFRRDAGELTGKELNRILDKLNDLGHNIDCVFADFEQKQEEDGNE